MGTAEYAFATEALRDGRLRRAFTVFIVVALLGLAVLGVATQLHPVGPQGLVARTVQGLVAASAVAVAALWMVRPWPTYRQALAFVLWADCAIVVVAVAMSAVEARLSTMLYMGLTGVFVGFILGSRIMFLHCGFGLAAIAGITAWAVAREEYTLFGLYVYYMPAVTWVIVVPLGGVVLIDIGRRAIRKTARSAHFDPLTGLRNRRGLHAAVTRVLREADGPRAVVVAVCDIDRFKTLNDQLGHAIGDAALVAMSEKLSAVADSGDVTARIGGDELVLVSFLPMNADVAASLERLRRLTRVESGGVELTASVGVAVESSTTAHFSIDDLVGHADAVMYDVKRAGGANYALYDARATASTTDAAADPRRDPCCPA